MFSKDLNCFDSQLCRETSRPSQFCKHVSFSVFTFEKSEIGIPEPISTMTDCLGNRKRRGRQGRDTFQVPLYNAA